MADRNKRARGRERSVTTCARNASGEPMAQRRKSTAYRGSSPGRPKAYAVERGSGGAPRPAMRGLLMAVSQIRPRQIRAQVSQIRRATSSRQIKDVRNFVATNILIEPSSQECDHAQEPSTSPASLAYQEKETSTVAPRDDEWLVRKAPGVGIIVADLIPLEGFPQIGRRLPRLPAERRPNRALAPTGGRA